MEAGQPMSRPALGTLVLLTLLLAGFSAFVGWNKAFAPVEILREHSAWTYHLPVLLGRLVGWLEMAAVVTLLLALMRPRLARLGRIAAAWITANHAVAAVVHVIHEEWHTLTQSAVVLLLCAIWLWLWRARTRSVSKRGEEG